MALFQHNGGWQFVVLITLWHKRETKWTKERKAEKLLFQMELLLLHFCNFEYTLATLLTLASFDDAIVVDVLHTTAIATTITITITI